MMNEAHKTRYSIHPGETKMYRNLKRQFWWKNMRREIAQYVAQGGAQETSWVTESPSHSRVEMGKYFDGLHRWVTQDTAKA